MTAYQVLSEIYGGFFYQGITLSVPFKRKYLVRDYIRDLAVK